MPLPEIVFGETDCIVPLGADTGTLDPPPSVTLHLRDIAHSRWESLQADAASELHGLGKVLHAMLQAVTVNGTPESMWTLGDCVEACTTWGYAQLEPITRSINELHNGPDTDSPLDFSALAAMATAEALRSMQHMSDSPTGQD